MRLHRQLFAFTGVQLVQHGHGNFAGGQVEGDAPGPDADDAREIADGQIDGMQAGNQRGARGFGFGDQQTDGGQRQCWIEGGYRLVGEKQIRLLVEDAGDADALQLAAGKLVTTGEQFVGQVNAVQRSASAGDIERVDQ